MKITVVIAVAAATFTGCSALPWSDNHGASVANEGRRGSEVDRICFNRSIDAFENAGDRAVVLKKGVNERYLVEVMGICPKLRHAQSIAIDSAMSCVTSGDHLLVSDSPIGLSDGLGTGPDRCAIDKMYTWHPAQHPAQE